MYLHRFALAALAAAALGAGIQSASAAGPVKAAPMTPVYNWTGCYVGIHAGGGWTKSDWVSTGGVNAHPDGDGVLIGGHIGCNYQIQTFVWGVEGDIDWTNIEGNGPWSSPGFTAPYKTNYLASVRGRLGFAFNQFLIYGTGGAAFAKWEYRTPECGVGVCGAYDNSNAGWVAGGGVEYGFSRSWTARVEYLYYDFGTVTSPAGGVDTVPTNIQTTVSVVRGGLTLRF